MSPQYTSLKILIPLCLVIGVFLEIFLHPGTLKAQPAASGIGIIHKVADVKNLPAPSIFMPLSVTLSNTKATDLNVRLVASSDGKLMNIAFPPGFLNERDMPVYKLKIPAPEGYISYQFIIESAADDFTVSERYILRRPCIPELRVEIPEDAPDAAFKKEASELFKKAKVLERETQSYENALQMVADLKELVKD